MELKRKFSEIKSNIPVFEGEIARLEKEKSKLEIKISELASANSSLALELRESMPSAIFSRAEPEGRNARVIRDRIEDLITPLKSEIDAAEGRISSLKKLCITLRAEARERDREVAVLKRAKRTTQAEIMTMSVLLEDKEHFDAELDREASFATDIMEIKVLPTGVSSRQAADQPSMNRSKDYFTRLRQRVGWMQEIVNASFLADCNNIRQLGHDGGSIAEADTLCVSAIITDENNDEPRHLVLAASALPAGKSAVATVKNIEGLFTRHREKYVLFLQYCVDHNIDVSQFPSPDGITLKKMAGGSIGMSDNAATALASTSLLIDLVRDLVEADFTAEQLAVMSPTEREKLVRVLRVGCFPHVRCLLAKWAVEEEEAFLKPMIPVAEQHLRLEPTLSSLLFAIQKNFLKGFDQYAKGEQNDFFVLSRTPCRLCYF
jgi:hypothetical protein